MHSKKRLVLLLVAGGCLLFFIVCGLVFYTLRSARHAVDLLPVGVSVAGKHVVFYVPPAERANAERLLPVADYALECYAHNLNVAVPVDPFFVTLFDTVHDYERACDLYNGGGNKANRAFAKDSQAFIYVQPRPAQTIAEKGCRMEELVAHELCHALHQRLFKGYHQQPSWLKEWVAEAWTERALSHSDHLQVSSDPYFAASLLVVRQSLQKGTFLPLDSLIQQSQSAFAGTNNYARLCKI